MTAQPGVTYLRFRICSYKDLSYEGPAEDGEVEDYIQFIEQIPPDEFDWGDAPDDPTAAGYPTLSTSNGARHLVGSGLLMGVSVDNEPDGQPTNLADGDDINGFPDDEDGVKLSTLAIKGYTALVEVITNGPGFLNAWADYNDNRSWLEADEHIFIDEPLNPGVNLLNLPIPEDAVFGRLYFRFRFSSVPGLSFDGPAPDGEVEDYRFKVHQGTRPLIEVTPTDVAVLDWDPVPGATGYTIFVSPNLDAFPATWSIKDFGVPGPLWTDTTWMPRRFYIVVAEPPF